MQIERVDRPRAWQACGVVIVIDVIRAFTVAAYAFAGGAQRLLLVRTRQQWQNISYVEVQRVNVISS